MVSYAKWIRGRVESSPKSQRFILGQRLSNHVMDVLETLVKASDAMDKTLAVAFRLARQACRY